MHKVARIRVTIKYCFPVQVSIIFVVAFKKISLHHVKTFSEHGLSDDLQTLTALDLFWEFIIETSYACYGEKDGSQVQISSQITSKYLQELCHSTLSNVYSWKDSMCVGMRACFLPFSFVKYVYHPSELVTSSQTESPIDRELPIQARLSDQQTRGSFIFHFSSAGITSTHHYVLQSYVCSGEQIQVLMFFRHALAN